MMKILTVGLALLALGAVATMVFAERQGTNTAPAKGRYLPEYTKEGDLLLPKNWRSLAGQLIRAAAGGTVSHAGTLEGWSWMRSQEELNERHDRT